MCMISYVFYIIITSFIFCASNSLAPIHIRNDRKYISYFLYTLILFLHPSHHFPLSISVDTHFYIYISIYLQQTMGAAEAGPSGRPAPSGGSGKGGRSKGTRPKKKVRATTTAALPVTIPPAATSGAGARAAGAISGGVGADASGPGTGTGIAGDANGDLVRMFPSSMDEYRQGCLRLEKFRHDKLFQSEKRYHYATKAIEQTYEWERRSAEEAYSIGCRQLVERVLMENLARMQRLEEKRFGTSHRPSEATMAYHDNNINYAAGNSNSNNNGNRPHGMALRTRNGGSGDENGHGNGGYGNIADGLDNDAGNIMTVDGGRASRRSRKENAGKSGNGGSGGSGNANGGGNHSKPRVTLMMALNEEDVASDLAKINRGKRGRENDHAPVQSERRYKKRK